MKGLTDRQKQILDFITVYITEQGYPPTIREIGKQMGIRSTNGVNDHLKALERKGYLRRDDLKSRAMRPVGLGVPAKASPPVDDLVRVPVLGRVAAGQPILAMEESDDFVRMDPALLGQEGEVFALRIVGESMIEDGIFDGDYVFVRQGATANRGDTVIALIDGEATCKRYYPEGDRIRFEPANQSMEPIYVHRRDYRDTMLLGRVVAVFRRL
jgi:repressor LexA